MALPLRAVLAMLAGVLSISAPLSSSAASPAAMTHVDRAIAAQGGEAALAGLRTVVIRGSDLATEIESSYEPGKLAKPKPAAESKFVIQRDLSTGNARIDWDRRVVRTPTPLLFKYSEIVSDGIGYVSGIDSTSRNQISRTSNPTGHPMSGARNANTQRELTRQSPTLLLDMKKNPGAVKAAATQTVGGKKYPAVQYDVRDWRFIVMFDPDTRLPARIRTKDGDPIQGDSNYDLVLSDWRDVGGVKIAHSQTYQLNGLDFVVAKYEQVTPNAAISPELFRIPHAARAIAVKAAMGGAVPHQWIMRRGRWGNLMDSDTIGWDVSERAEPALVDIAPGVSFTEGVSHNNMIVEMPKYLIVFEAPINEQLSEWTIRAAKARYPGKPIKYLMLTHHHWDHTSGARTYVAEGATVIVGKGNKAHFTRQFTAPGAALDDRLHHNPRKPNIIEVTDKFVLKEGKREVGMYSIDTEDHSTGTLIGMVHDQRLGFVTDLWSPGRDPLPKTPSKNMIDVVKGVKRHNLNPERFAGGHGSVGSYPELAQLVGGL